MASGIMTNGVDSLPLLAQETELQKLLADERMRSDQHRTNYQTLKTEHSRLQDEFISVQEELESVIAESKLVQEKYQGMLEQCRKELMTKNSLIEELKGQVPSEQKNNLIRLELRDEVEGPYRAKIAALNNEIDACRSELNKAKYQYTFLRSEYEHEKTEHQRIVEELKLRYEAEVANLRKENEALNTKLQGDPQDDLQRIRTLQRENAQLHLKLKGAYNELEEIQKQKENSGLQSENVSRMQNKQLAEHQATIKALQTEKESLKRQYENIQRELSSALEVNTELTGQVHRLEKDNLQLKNKAEEVSHKAKVELTDLKMQMLKERGDLQRDLDRCASEIEDLKSQIEVVQYQLDQQTTALLEKEREASKRVQAAHEEEWKKLHNVENEKMDLETRVQELERLRIDEETRLQRERDQAQDAVRSATDEKDFAEKQLLLYKIKLDEQESCKKQLEQQREDNGNLKMELHRLQMDYNSYVSNEAQLLEHNTHLKKQVEALKEEIHLSREEVSKTREHLEQALADQRLQWSEEKLNMQARLDSLDQQLSSSQVKAATAANDSKKKIKKYARLIQKLRDRHQILSAQNEELKIEVDTLRKSVPPQAHLKLKKQLNDLLRRHREFRTVLTTADASLLPDASLNTTKPDFDFFNNEMYRKNLEEIRERVVMLDDNQRAQLNELLEADQITLPKPRPRHFDTDLSDLSDDELDNKDSSQEKKFRK